MANMLREWLRLLVKRISGFVFGNFLVIEIVVAIYEPFVMHEFVELVRMTWHGATLYKRLLLPDSLGLHTQTIARHDRLCDAHKNVSTSLAASRTWLPSFFHGACLNKLLSAVRAFGTVFERHSCDVQRDVDRRIFWDSCLSDRISRSVRLRSSPRNPPTPLDSLSSSINTVFLYMLLIP